MSYLEKRKKLENLYSWFLFYKENKQEEKMLNCSEQIEQFQKKHNMK